MSCQYIVITSWGKSNQIKPKSLSATIVPDGFENVLVHRSHGSHALNRLAVARRRVAAPRRNARRLLATHLHAFRRNCQF
jgi:hypothetical protein